MYQSITMNEMQRMKDINIIDVRESEEHQMGVIEGAILMPLNTIPSHLDELDKEETYHLVCHSGNRSSIAAQYLSKQGYNVVNVMGGMSAYSGKLSHEV
ncbi:MAG: rhodanese-like domain-containing protein [Erysipelothrix sp.]|nr:rhodanese-like domain-containing protein [Erysipelothrix sp.]